MPVDFAKEALKDAEASLQQNYVTIVALINELTEHEIWKTVAFGAPDEATAIWEVLDTIQRLEGEIARRKERLLASD